MRFRLVTPDRVLADEEVEAISLPTVEGEVTVLPHHASLTALLAPGIIKIQRSKTEIEDLYRSPKFPQWVGFFWTPRYNTRRPVSFDELKSELRTLHANIRTFYEGKDEDVLGNLYLYDPLFGWCNLIVTLRIGVYHDQLHYDDVIKQVKQFRK